MRSLIKVVWVILLVGVTPVTWAATRTVCYSTAFLDARFPASDAIKSTCPASGAPGVRRGCTRNANQPMVGHVFELWDKDVSSDDDYILSFVVSGAGRRCVSFDWESHRNRHGEANPDLYLRYAFKVSCHRNGVAGDSICSSRHGAAAFREDDVQHGPIVWRDDALIANNCRAGTTCEIAPGSALIPALSPDSPVTEITQVMDSAQHAFQVYGHLFTADPKIYVDDFGGNPHAGGGNIYIPTGGSASRNGITTAHEVGHVLDGQLSGDHVNGCTPADHHSTDKTCAMQEGWADYVAVTSWWFPNNPASAPEIKGRGFEAATNQPWINPSSPGLNPDGCAKTDKDCWCRSNQKTETQVTRTLWDLSDANQENSAGGIVPSTAHDRAKITPQWVAKAMTYIDPAAVEQPKGYTFYDYFWGMLAMENAQGKTGYADALLNAMRHNCTYPDEL